MPGNAEAWALLSLGSTQARAGMGGFIGFDYVALARLADDMGFGTSPALWRKIRAIEGAAIASMREDKNGSVQRGGGR